VSKTSSKLLRREPEVHGCGRAHGESRSPTRSSESGQRKRNAAPRKDPPAEPGAAPSALRAAANSPIRTPGSPSGNDGSAGAAPVVSSGDRYEELIEFLVGEAVRAWRAKECE